MRVSIFKTKFNDNDFELNNLETAVEEFEDEINGHIYELEKEGCEDIDITFKFFDDGRAIATIVIQD